MFDFELVTREGSLIASVFLVAEDLPLEKA